MKKHFRFNAEIDHNFNFDFKKYLNFGRKVLMWLSVIHLTGLTSPITILEAVSHYQTKTPLIADDKEVNDKNQTQNHEIIKKPKKVKKKYKKCQCDRK